MPRTLIPLQSNWKYTPSFEESFLLPDYDDSEFETVTLPHTNIEVPYNYFDEKLFQFVSCYRTIIDPGVGHQGKRLFLDFAGVMAYAEVYLNGELLGSHKGGYTPFSVEVTDTLDPAQPNVLAVKVDSREREDIPPFGGSIDYLTFGGIYREVTLRIVEPVYITNVHARPEEVLTPRPQLSTSVFLTNTLSAPQVCTVTVALNAQDREIARTETSVTLAAKCAQRVEVVLAELEQIALWKLDNPALYTCEVCVRNDESDGEDTYQTRVGFRTAEFTPEGFFLNGERIMLRGLNRHQTFPYVGQAMPARAQRKDADILKDELHLNLVRTSHYPQSIHFLDRCDEIGLLVLEEIPGWQHIGNDAWKEVAYANVREMIQRDWNHPSIISWGVRINESPDDHDFYAETNRIAHELDPARQTSGIRCIPDSELLEDIYTMNDFSHSGGDLVLKPQQEITGLDHPVPYMVTEFNGHMFPTKRFDQEERAIEHAIRHARVQNRAAADEQICGAIGWCAFDYNTHQNFGSGDRICYHGVMDMFRIPKMAAQFYRSQVAPDCEIVLEPATLWARGERSIGGIIPLTIFTNCEKIDFYYGEHFLGAFTPAYDEFPGLEYPPVIISSSPEELGVWGHTWEDARFVGYVAGIPAIEKRCVKDPVPVRLLAVADDTSLRADGIDVTRIVLTMEDQAGNITPYVHEPLHLEISGPGTILGPAAVALIGGAIGVWVRTLPQEGLLTFVAEGPRFRSNEVSIRVEK